MEEQYKTRKYRSIDGHYTATATLYPFSADTYRGEHVYVEVHDAYGRVDWARCANWEHVVERLTRAFGWGWERVRG